MVWLKAMNSVVFVILALWHVYWASGGKVGSTCAIPAISSTDSRPLFVPRPHMTALIAVLLFGMAVSQWFTPAINQWTSGVLAFIFFARTIGDRRHVGLLKTIRPTQFSQWDDRYFVPLCFLLGLSHVCLVMWQ